MNGFGTAERSAQLVKLAREAVEKPLSKELIEIEATLAAKRSVQYALKHVFERASVVHEITLIKEALKHPQGEEFRKKKAPLLLRSLSKF